MGAYWKAVIGHVRGAAFDVLFVAIFSLAPFLLGRLVLLRGPQGISRSYWDFLSNGQMAFFSMGSLATLMLLCFRKKLPDVGTLMVGTFSLLCLLFLMVLVGFDPTLQAAAAFVGQAALWLYVSVLIVRVLAEAMKAVKLGDALEAGANVDRRTQQGLEARMGGKA